MKIWKFITFSAVGIFIWDGVLIYLGFLAGLNSSMIISVLTNDFTVIEIAAVIVVIASIFLAVARNKKSRKQVTKPSDAPANSNLPPA